MEVVHFNDIKDNIISHFKNQTFVPIIGSGFSCGCKSKKGNVPSGSEYRKYMIDEINKSCNISDDEKESVSKMTFSQVADIYNELVDLQTRINYLKDNFSRVVLEHYKKVFLTIEWPYIYTLNLDDAIENNSNYDYVILPDKEMYEDIIDEEKCIIKIHGDVKYLTTYKEDNCVLTQKQYVNSIKKNKFILDRLRHDSSFLNIAYIGCSLDDEIDIKSIIDDTYANTITARYYFGIKEPSNLDKIKLKNFGITHFVIFDSYESIYKCIYNAWQESTKLSKDDLELYKIKSSCKLNPDYKENKEYLLFGKSLKSGNELKFPYYFVERNISNTIIKRYNDHPIQIIIGKGCSGKTYVLSEIASKVKDKNVYLFESKNRLSVIAFEKLIAKQNCLLIFDSKSLDRNQMEQIIDSRYELVKKNTHVIIAADNTDQDLNRLLILKQIQHQISSGEIPTIKLSNKFSKEECSTINPLLATINLGIMDKSKTIVDNIINIGNTRRERNKFENYSIKTDSIEYVASLIMLAIENKIYSQRAVQFDLEKEFELQVKCAAPLISKEVVWNFEKSPKDNSPKKYVVDAEYWLRWKLKDFAQDESNEQLIAESFKYIVTVLLAINEKPSIEYSDNSSYKDYVLFDNINKIFSKKQNGANRLIRKIYESLNPLLSADPNFKHQYAKCYIQSSKTAISYEERINFLYEAKQNIVEALEIFETRYKNNLNNKLKISIAHAKYTLAVVLCHMCKTEEYKNADLNNECIRTLFEAMLSEYNSFDYVKKDQFNYRNAVQETINYFTINQDGLEKKSVSYVQDLINMKNSINN